MSIENSARVMNRAPLCWNGLKLLEHVNAYKLYTLTLFKYVNISLTQTITLLQHLKCVYSNTNMFNVNCVQLMCNSVYNLY